MICEIESLVVGKEEYKRDVAVHVTKNDTIWLEVYAGHCTNCAEPTLTKTITISELYDVIQNPIGYAEESAKKKIESLEEELKRVKLNMNDYNFFKDIKEEFRQLNLKMKELEQYKLKQKLN